MKISLYPPGNKSTKCLILVGGDGDTIEVLAPLTKAISSSLPGYIICTFDFTTEPSSQSVLDINAAELILVCQELVNDHGIEVIDIWCTSRGAYPTVKLLGNKDLAKYVRKVILYDPADYYLGETDLHSWSGYMDYSPVRRVVSDDLENIIGDCLIDVVHLTLKNYSPGGYFESEYPNRGKDNPLGFLRLSTKMVKSFYAKIPSKNRGEYIEDPTVPHGFVRDGDLVKNLDQVSNLAVKIITN